MTKREKILIFLCFFAAVSGGFYYFINSGDKLSSDEERHNNEIKKLTTFVHDISRNSSEKDIEKDLYIIKKAGEKWIYDPFYKTEFTLTKITDNIRKIYDVNIYKYTGYIKFENQIYAIINGEEYKVGEKIKDSECLVYTITSRYVILVIDGKKITLNLEKII